MQISNAASQVVQSMQSGEPTEGIRANLQVTLLKKILQAQQEHATEIQRLADGKGQVLDLRV